MNKTATMLKIEEFEEKLKNFEEEKKALEKAHEAQLRELGLNFATALNLLGQQITALTSALNAATEDRRKRLEKAVKQLKSE